MRNKEYGLSLSGLLVGSVIVIVVVLLGLKLAPVYVEYFTAKKTITEIAQSQPSATSQEVRQAFDAHQAIDNIPSLKPSDLDITKENGRTVIGFAYRKEVPLFANIGLYIDFQADTRGR